MKDIAGVRNFVKYVYDNANDPNKRLRNIFVCLVMPLLIIKQNSQQHKHRAFLHSINSFSLTNSFISDDFYGMMDDNEGAMNNSDKLDIAVEESLRLLSVLKKW